MYGYIADHNNGRTLILSDGRVFEHREQPGGGANWHERRGETVTDVDAYLIKASDEWGADWTELQDWAEITERTGIKPDEADIDPVVVLAQKARQIAEQFEQAQGVLPPRKRIERLSLAIAEALEEAYALGKADKQD